MRLVIDTNIWVSSLSRKSSFNWIFQSFVDKKITLILSHEILLEYEEILKIKYSEKAVEIFLKMIEESENVEYVESFFQWNFLNDQDDNKFVDVAIAANADFILTEDKDFKILKSVPFPKVEIIDIDQFLKLLSRN